MTITTKKTGTARQKTAKPTTASLASTPLAVPDRATRVAQLRNLLGQPDGDVAPLAAGIRGLAFRSYETHVVPLVERHWPQVLDEPFGKKLRYLSCNLCASAPYTVLFSAPNRPWMVRAITDTANRLPLPRALLARAARTMLAALGRRVAYAHEHRRIILIAAFITTIDHAFDHCMDDDSPEERGRKMHGLLDGTWTPDTPPLALTSALHEAMAAHLRPNEEAPFHAALARVREWVDSEVAGMSGQHDPTGLGFRLAGVEGTIDGLIYPVYRYAGERARQWMYDCSLFIQMMDDWIDYDLDRETSRITPVISGHWDFPAIAEMWWKTVHGIEQLTRDGGLRAPHYVDFMRETYVFLLHEVMEAMITGLAD